MEELAVAERADALAEVQIRPLQNQNRENDLMLIVKFLGSRRVGL
jgi:hypothetical protein